MATNPVDSKSIVEDYFTMPAQRNPGQLGKDDFLNLLVTQLRYQDPLKPMEDKEFISQMAQFSSLEQMQNMNTNLNNVKAFGMIGKQVSAMFKNDKTGELESIEGLVESVKLSGGKPYAFVNGRDIPVDDITDVYDTATYQPSKITDFTSVIGKNVTAGFIDAKTMEYLNIIGDVRELELIDGTVYSVLDNADVLIEDIKLSKEEQDLFTDIETYLQQKIDKAEEITAVIVKKDEKGEIISKVTVKGIVKDFDSASDDKLISATMEGIRIPANNILGIR